LYSLSRFNVTLEEFEMVLKCADVCGKENMSLLLGFEKFLSQIWLVGVSPQCDLIFPETLVS